MPSRRTIKTGPTLQKEIRPKLSLEPFLSFLVAERPTPIAIIKGTVMGPVVTPPESNATAIKSAGARERKKKQCNIKNAQKNWKTDPKENTEYGDH